MDYIAHYGTLGMKWGRRRYQNEDGTLTPEGIARYRKMKKPSFEGDGRLTGSIAGGVVTGFKAGGPLGGLVGGAAGAVASSGIYAVKKHKYDSFKKAYDKTIEKNREEYETSPEHKKYLKSLEKLGQKLNNGEASDLVKTSDKSSIESFESAKLHESDWANGLELYSAKAVRDYVKKAVKNFNEHDPDQVVYQHMSKEEQMFDLGYITKDTFNKLYDAKLNEEAFDYANSWSKDEIERWHDLGGTNGNKGQHWGIRRYQNEDGTLTEEGKARYQKSSGRYKTGSKKNDNLVNDPTMSIKDNADWQSEHEGRKVSQNEYIRRLEKDPGYIKVKDKSASGDGGNAFVKIEDKSKAVVSLSYLGYSDKEIAKILGMPLEQVKKV